MFVKKSKTINLSYEFLLNKNIGRNFIKKGFLNNLVLEIIKWYFLMFKKNIHNSKENSSYWYKKYR